MYCAFFSGICTFFWCPKESTKEKGSPSGNANDLRGLRCFWQVWVQFSVNTVVFRPVKKGAPSCVGTIPFGRACLADGRCQRKKISVA